MRFTEIDLTRAALNRREDWASLRMPAACDKGLVSVIVPTYNRAAFLQVAIDSVLSQTYRPIELLIVDDGSTDGTADMIRQKFNGMGSNDGISASAVYLRQPNRGASAARNQGLLYSHGEFIQYLDSDDVLVRDKIARHVTALTNASLDVVWSKWLVLPSEQLQPRLQEINDKLAPENVEAISTNDLLPWEPWPTLTRRQFLVSHPLWNEHVSRWDDWEFALRQMSRQPRRAVVAGVGCIQREHALGRRQDFDFDPQGVDLGLNACRAAAKSCFELAFKNDRIRQIVGVRFWETGLEALLRGTDEQALEAFQAAASLGTWIPFRAKALGASAAMKFLGRRPAKLLLSRYLPHMKSEPLAVG